MGVDERNPKLLVSGPDFRHLQRLGAVELGHRVTADLGPPSDPSPHLGLC